ncbi:MAG: 50S ribosomal protein L18 [Rickettsiella sp.]|nr:50S ribosomal protein L18 [Rickettsiella sp.]
MSLDKKTKRKRRATKTRAKIRKLVVPRLCVNRSSQHIYAQIIVSAEKGDKVLVSASTLDKEVKEGSAKTNNMRSADIIGDIIAKRAIAAGIKNVAFDRSGFKYHGCIKALAEAARVAGLFF